MITSSFGDMFARLLLALVCAAVIGLNRDLHRKSAGFRTFGLVGVGSAIVALVITQTSTDANAVSRVIQGVLTGVGFLGAGVILHQPTSSRVKGLTTAAAVWLTAGLGLACGLGQFSLALSGLGVAFVILLVGKPVEQYFEKVFLRRQGGRPQGPQDPADSDD